MKDLDYMKSDLWIDLADSKVKQNGYRKALGLAETDGIRTRKISNMFVLIVLHYHCIQIGLQLKVTSKNMGL